jgi:adenosylcobinamide kinase/adenosylcobinamide-phosphate guanylyltransferase
VDGHLLIDPGPDVGSRGVDLTGVRTVLITHDHPDHLDPAFLLAWSWAGGTHLTVAGPPDAVERCRQWVSPRAPVRFRPLASGDEVPAGPLLVRALPAAHSSRQGAEHDGTALLYEVSGEARLLYATDTAALPHDHLEGRYDLVLLELTFGDVTDHGTAHLDLPGFGHEVAQLRAAGRLNGSSRVVAVHLSHHNPVDLDERLSAVGAEVLPDGSAVLLAGDAGGHRQGRRLLVTGGARSGKSRHAEALLTGRPEVTYVATAPPATGDPEWARRVEAHRARRPPTWQVRETDDLAGVLSGSRQGHAVLVDCMTLWLSRAIDRADGWASPAAGERAVRAALDELLHALRQAPADVVLVTNEVGSGIVPAHASGRLFRDLLGMVNASLAQACDDVAIVTCGIPRTLKGHPWHPST